LQFKDPYTGENLVDTVLHKEEVSTGPYLDYAPDLSIVWKNYQVRNIINIAEKDKLVDDYDKSTKIINRNSSNHKREGIFIVSGGDISNEDVPTKVDIKDICPTILYLFDCNIPEDMDGQVITSIINKDLLKSKEIQYSTSEKESQKTTYIVSDDKIKERLKSLDYF
jgi:predicted AlkP superfamily phosphohydrolase/phosphomutase